MPYSKFKSLDEIKENFNIKISDRADLFSGVEEIKPNKLLYEILGYNTRLALAIHTEKARSELIVMPILVEVIKTLEPDISLFSGITFDVDEEKGLNGICDFIISKSSEQTTVNAPIVAMVEAKDNNVKEGLPQCSSEMVAAKIFNDKKKNGLKVVYGVVTTGEIWQFLKLENNTLFIDSCHYYIKEINKILGILIYMVRST